MTAAVKATHKKQEYSKISKLLLERPTNTPGEERLFAQLSNNTLANVYADHEVYPNVQTLILMRKLRRM